MTRLAILKYLMLAFAGTIMLIGATLNVTLSPKAQAACGSNPNCSGGWSVDESECSSFPCTCGSNNIPYTCYREVGTCNATGLPVVFTHCFEGGCCCPSGNCAGQGGGGGGGKESDVRQMKSAGFPIIAMNGASAKNMNNEFSKIGRRRSSNCQAVCE